MEVGALSRHLCILGTTGSWKSAFAAVITLELDRRRELVCLRFSRSASSPACALYLPLQRIHT